MDSLRYWVTEMHVDGFRFDLAVHAGPRVPRGRPAVRLLRPHPAGPGRQPGQADRRAVGRRRRRLPGRQLPAAVDRVERQVPRHRARLLARRGRRRSASSPLGFTGSSRPLRALRPPADRLDQLRHRPRRLHAARPRLLQREAQRGQRRGQPRRREPQPLVELRRRGPDRRPRGPRRCAPRQQRNFLATLLLSPGRADAAARRRARPHPARQQQRLLPGQRDLAGSTGTSTRTTRRSSSSPQRSCSCAASTRCSAAAASSPAAPTTAARASSATSPGSRPTAQHMAEDDWSNGRRQVAHACSSTATAIPEPDRPRRADPRRPLPRDVQRARRADRLHAARRRVRRGVDSVIDTALHGIEANPLEPTWQIQVQPRSIVVLRCPREIVSPIIPGVTEEATA